MEVVAALLEGGPGERSVGRACCLALCQAGAVEPLLKTMTGNPQCSTSLKVTLHMCLKSVTMHVNMAREAR